MWCAERLFSALLVLGGSGCTVLNRLDTCDPPADHDVQVNATTSGHQYTTYGRSLVRLPSGKLIAAWMSEADAQQGAPTEIRATVLTTDGKVVTPCAGTTGDVLVSTALDRVLSRVAVAVGPVEGSPVYFAWRATALGPMGSSPGSIQVRLMTQELCPYGTSMHRVLVVSDPTEDAAAPSLAVREDGKEALVSWISLQQGGQFSAGIRSRPVETTLDALGALEKNACDGADAPCTHSSGVMLSAPALTAFRDGYALAWAEPRAGVADGLDVRLQLLDRLGKPRTDARGARRYGNVEAVHLSLASTAAEVWVAQAGVARADVATPDDNDVFLERFGIDGGSQGLPTVVNALKDGQQLEPALAVTPDGGAIFVSWMTGRTGEAPRVFGRMLSASMAPQFSGLVCDTTDFPLSSMSDGGEYAPSVSVGEVAAHAMFIDEGTAPGGNDTLGRSIHLRRYDLARLFPALAPP